MCTFFSFIEYPAHQQLPSFPTRRSSDLSSTSSSSESSRGGACRPASSFLRHIRIGVIPRRREGLLHRSRRHPPRSEEHTSELQSQSNLVCRLLLEKKK